jgi:hypothetical protein
MQYIIYQITNQINGKIYIGAHATKDINDDYMGSGHVLANAKKKHGIENFTKEILYIFADEKSMYAKEKEIVTEEFCDRKDNYNVRVGGIGGWNHVNSNPEKYRAIKSYHSKIKANRPDNPFKDPEFQKKYEWTRAPDRMRMLGKKAQTPKAVAKRKATLKEIKHQQGEKNSQFGRYWISHPVTKEVKRITMNDAIPEGWVKGKKGFVPKMCWVNDGQVEHFIPIEKKQEYISNGYTSGRFESSMPQNRIVV